MSTKKKRKNKKNTEKKPDKLPLRRVLQNNRYMLGMIRRAAPAYMLVDVILDLLWSVIEFFSGSFLLKVVVDHLGEGGDPATLAWFIGGMFFIHVTVFFAQQAFWQIYAPISQRKLSMAIRTALYTQMRSVELSCYENPEYYEKYVKAMNEAEDRAFNVLWSLERLFGQVFSLISLNHCNGNLRSQIRIFTSTLRNTAPTRICRDIAHWRECPCNTHCGSLSSSQFR